MINNPLPRLDKDPYLYNKLLEFSRFSSGKIWKDPKGKHRIACIDACDEKLYSKMMGGEKSSLAVNDPPYNFIIFDELLTSNFINWCRQWVKNIYDNSTENSALYIWLGADQKNHFQPLPQFMMMMMESGFSSRSFISMRNQRGYGTQKNWMAVRQELLYYIKGNPDFNISAEYTDIPKVMNGYYKVVSGKVTNNFERSKSNTIRAGNIWIDIQQVFYRMEENVSGCYAQKPMKSIERIVQAGSKENEIVVDLFSHSGTTLVAGEKLNRRCFTSEIDPLYCEITLRRLENFRKTGKTGWQNSNPFHKEIDASKELTEYLKEINNKEKAKVLEHELN